MSNKDSFSKEEWQDLQWAVMLAGSHVSASDYPGLWDSFKEAAGGSRFLTGMKSATTSWSHSCAKTRLGSGRRT